MSLKLKEDRERDVIFIHEFIGEISQVNNIRDIFEKGYENVF